MEAEGGGNDTDMKVGKFKMSWEVFDYRGAVVEKAGEWEGADFPGH